MRILRRGDTGADVKLAQQALERAGYDPGSINGVFGYETERAVKRFQRVLGAKEDGIIGPVTWKYLEPFALEPDSGVLRRGSRGSLVSLLQEALREAGFYTYAVDGLFGTRTQSALMAFQKSVGLKETGVANAETWLAIAPYIDYTGIYVRPGSSGIFVAIVQTALKNAGYDPGTVDGKYSAKTASAIKDFQSDNKLAADGIVGPKTWEALEPYIGATTIIYTVKKGDTLTSIAEAYKTTVDAILKLNPRDDPNLIYIGEKLIIPVGK